MAPDRSFRSARPARTAQPCGEVKRSNGFGQLPPRFFDTLQFLYNGHRLPSHEPGGPGYSRNWFSPSIAVRLCDGRARGPPRRLEAAGSAGRGWHSFGALRPAGHFRKVFVRGFNGLLPRRLRLPPRTVRRLATAPTASLRQLPGWIRSTPTPGAQPSVAFARPLRQLRAGEDAALLRRSRLVKLRLPAAAALPPEKTVDLVLRRSPEPPSNSISRPPPFRRRSAAGLPR